MHMIKQVKKVDTKLCYASSFVKICVCVNTQYWEECAKIMLEEIYQNNNNGYSLPM